MYDLKIFTDLIEPSAINQIYEMIAKPPFEGAKVRIMPDAHSGAGCVVGFTSTMTDKIVPNVIGVDIGCGMLTVNLGNIKIDYAALDDFIKNEIPAGSDYNEKDSDGKPFADKLLCKSQLRDICRVYGSLGTLGGGNHFIEVDKAKNGDKYLIIHSGSRNLGLQVAKIYTKKAVEECKNAPQKEREELIERLKSQGRVADIPNALKELTAKYAHRTKLTAEFCYLEGVSMQNYMHDMRICQDFAVANRKKMCDKIVKYLKITKFPAFETVHNFIDEKGIIRKGAVPAHKGQKLIIPMNMKDGCLICEGLGNEDWNCSAPHGAGRLYSRSAAKKLFTVAEFQAEMNGIFTTTANESTLDESPMAYKPTKDIINRIGDTVKIIDIVKPVYNFKAAEDSGKYGYDDKKRK